MHHSLWLEIARKYWAQTEGLLIKLPFKNSGKRLRNVVVFLI